MASLIRCGGLAVTLVLIGCQAPLQRPGLLPLVGRVATGQVATGRIGATWQTQSTLADFTPGGIVSLIEPASERTIAGTITQADGTFTLSFEPDLQPANGSAYWLDVSRRRTEGWLSLRTAAVWSDGRWLSISNGPDTPLEPLLINTRTTAISLMLQDSGAAFTRVLGKTSGLELGPGRNDATASDMQAQVQRALSDDRDPLTLSAGAVLAVTPAAVASGETVTVQGFGFGGSGTVTLGDEPATVTSWQSGQLVIRTAVGARGGDLIIKPDGRRPIRSGQPVRIRQQWRTWPELPVPVGGETVAVGSLDGQLVVAGGKDATGKAIGAVWGYAGRSGQWRSLAPLPTPRYGMTSAVLGNRLYAIGGWSDSTGYSPVVEVYDPATDSWQRRAPLPTGLLGAAAAAVNGQVIVCGGYNGTEQANTYLYDPAGNTWTARSVMPQARFRHGAANFDGRILVAGGRSGNQPSSNVIQFDLVANVWSDTTSLPATRAGGTMVSDGVTAWFVDGSDGRPQATLWGFNGAGWVTLAIPPTARASISGTFGAGEVVIVGGTSGDAAAGRRVESFTP